MLDMKLEAENERWGEEKEDLEAALRKAKDRDWVQPVHLQDEGRRDAGSSCTTSSSARPGPNGRSG